VVVPRLDTEGLIIAFGATSRNPAFYRKRDQKSFSNEPKSFEFRSKGYAEVVVARWKDDGNFNAPVGRSA
jgi:hypothetical protein